MMTRWILTICFTLLAGLPGLRADAVRVAGSDLLNAALGEWLPELAQERGLGVETNFIGSIPAETRLQDGTADIGLVAVPDGMEKPGSGMLTIPFAYRVLWVVVGDTNPLNEITMEQLAGIYGSGTRLNIERWSDLQQLSLGGSRPVVPIVQTQEDRIILNLFMYTAMGESTLKPRVERIAGRVDVLDAVAGDNTTIGLIGFQPKTQRVKVIPVAKNDGGSEEFAFGPTPQNVYHGDYIFRLPIYIVVRENRAGELLPAINLLLSDEVAERLAKNDFMAVPEEIRRAQLMELDKGE